MATVVFTITLGVADDTPTLMVDILGEDLLTHVSQFLGKKGPAKMAWVLEAEDLITESEARTLESDLKEGRY